MLTKVQSLVMTFLRVTMVTALALAGSGMVAARSEAQNLLLNGSFDTVGPIGSPTTITTVVPGGAGFSAAESWTLFTNTAGTISTELMPSSLVPGGTMIYVTTDGINNGLVQVFGDFGTGPERVLSCAWIYLARGEVGIGTGNGGNTPIDMVLRKTGSWELLQVSNGVSPANEFIIYAFTPGGADFYVESARVQTSGRRCRPE
jgi:hypothetical protein